MFVRQCDVCDRFVGPALGVRYSVYPEGGDVSDWIVCAACVADGYAGDDDALIPGWERVAFSFDDVTAYGGVTDWSTWNGFLNVRVTPEVREVIARDCAASYGEDGADTVEELRALPVGPDGLVDLGGAYATFRTDIVGRCACGHSSDSHDLRGIGSGADCAASGECDDCAALGRQPRTVAIPFGYWEGV